jgi:glutamine synthetase type III
LEAKMTAKKLYLYLAIATAVGALLGTFCTIAYNYGCSVQKVEKVTEATAELYVDVKEIKADVNDLKVNGAVVKEQVKSISKDVSTIMDWIKPRQLSEVTR